MGKEGEGGLGVAQNTSGSPWVSGASTLVEQRWVGVACLPALGDWPIRVGWAEETGGGPAVCPRGSWELVGTRAEVRDQSEAGAMLLAQMHAAPAQDRHMTFWRPPQASLLVCAAVSSSACIFSFPLFSPWLCFKPY